jgi:hypothetical protein
MPVYPNELVEYLNSIRPDVLDAHSWRKMLKKAKDDGFKCSTYDIKNIIFTEKDAEKKALYYINRGWALKVPKKVKIEVKPENLDEFINIITPQKLRAGWVERMLNNCLEVGLETTAQHIIEVVLNDEYLTDKILSLMRGHYSSTAAFLRVQQSYGVDLARFERLLDAIKADGLLSKKVQNGKFSDYKYAQAKAEREKLPPPEITEITKEIVVNLEPRWTCAASLFALNFGKMIHRYATPGRMLAKIVEESDICFVLHIGAQCTEFTNLADAKAAAEKQL